MFNKYRAESCTAEINEVELPEKTTSEVLDLAELFSSVHVLQSQVTTLTEARADDLEHINNLQIEIKNLQKRNDDLSLTLCRIEQDISSTKSTITAIRRENSETLKTLKTTDCQSCTENTSKLNKLSREVNKISSTIQSIKEIKNSGAEVTVQIANPRTVSIMVILYIIVYKHPTSVKKICQVVFTSRHRLR